MRVPGQCGLSPPIHHHYQIPQSRFTSFSSSTTILYCTSSSPLTSLCVLSKYLDSQHLNSPLPIALQFTYSHSKRLWCSLNPVGLLCLSFFHFISPPCIYITLLSSGFCQALRLLSKTCPTTSSFDHHHLSIGYPDTLLRHW